MAKTEDWHWTTLFDMRNRTHITIAILATVSAIILTINKCCCKHDVSVEAPEDSILMARVTALNTHGVMQQERNDRIQALQSFTEAYMLAMQCHDRRKAVDICINCADVERQIGRVGKAASWYRRANAIADSIGDNYAQNSILAGLGQVYADLHNYRLSHRYFSKAEKMCPPQTPKETYFFYNSWGNAYSAEGRPREAMRCFRKSQEAAMQTKEAFAIAVVAANLGQTFLEIGKFDSAHAYLDMASTYFFDKPDRDDAIQFYLDGLQASLALKEQDYSKAHKYLSKPYNIVRMSPSYMYLHNKRMADYCEHVGRYADAVHYQRLVAQYDDSLRNTIMVNAVADAELRFQQDTAIVHRDTRIAASEAKAASTRVISLLAIAILTLVIVTIIIMWRYKIAKAQSKNAEQGRRIMELKMATVRNRFSPHFVFNVLNAFIPSVSGDKASASLFLLIKMLRNNLLVCEKIAVTLDDELEQVRNYSKLRHTVNNNIPEINVIIDDNVDMQTLIPSMMIQIPVENALKYAFNDMDNGESPELLLHVYENGDELHMTLTDNGKGINIPALRERHRMPHSAVSTGTGLKILYSTIEMLNRNNTDKIIFRIENRNSVHPAEHGTRIVMQVPKNYKY